MSFLKPGVCSCVMSLAAVAAAGCTGGSAAPSEVGVQDAGTAAQTDASVRDAGLATAVDASVRDAGDAGTAPDSGIAATECVDVTGAGTEPWLDLQIVGEQLDAHENARIRVVVSADPNGRLGVAAATITNGAFELLMPDTINYGYYTEIALYVDVNGNDACDEGEAVWGFVSGIVQDDLRLEVNPLSYCVRNGGPQVGAGCRSWHAPAGTCTINGVTDLEVARTCPR